MINFVSKIDIFIYYFTFLRSKIDISLNLTIKSRPPSGIKPLTNDKPHAFQKVENYLLEEKFSDLKITCEEKEFPVHKLILSVRSDVFKTMFSSEGKFEIGDDKLKLEDTNEDTLHSFLRYLYTDEIKDQVDCKLLILADKYNVKELVQNCVQALENHMTCENVLEIAYSAYLINDQKLIAKASEFILNNRGGIKQGEFWEELKMKNLDVTSKVMSLLLFGNLK